jgi:two-component system OmpR family sensor kinase
VSLRARLLIGLVVLATIGLSVAGIVTYEEQHAFLFKRVDEQVAASAIPVAAGLGLLGPRPQRNRPPAFPAGVKPPAEAGTTFQASGTYGVLLDAAGNVLKSRSFTYGQRAASAPDLPARLPVSRLGATDVTLLTVNSKAGSGLRYRVAAFALSRGRVLAVAVPLHDVDQTLQRLIDVEVIVGLSVIFGLVALGWIMIRVGLSPLQRMGQVASEIARGDLSRRVTPAGSRTEVGRLGSSLNAMLGQIERAFADRAASEERLRRFLADASHELRTPLAAIRGYAEVFRLGAARDHAALTRAMSRIESEAARMGVLVEDLLLLAELDKLPEMRLVPLDLRELVEHAADDARAMAPQRSVRVSANAPAWVLGDPWQLGQVLANLTRNAIIHTPPDSAIELTVERRDGRAVLEVRDHGPGLPPDAGERVFDRFWRSEGGRKRGRGGSGLGLAIVKAIAHGHHGQVEAHNASDGGAVFCVTLPSLDAPDSAELPSTEREPSERPADARPGSPRSRI